MSIWRYKFSTHNKVILCVTAISNILKIDFFGI